jgi:GH35 family endo-1,4-beta-xylanase/dienelactone hydrolase
MNLKTAFEPYFKVGAAISGHNLRTPAHLKLLSEQFGSFTAENDMKPMYFLDQDTNKSDPEKYDRAPALTFDRAIPYLEYAKASGMKMRGHTLVWHNQTPKWFFRQGYNENLPYADRETMLARLESYIHGVLNFVQTTYPGIIYAWDVVNEAIDDGDFRKSLWTKTVGTDFVEQAFTFARKYAAPGVSLFYNDYETAQVWKRDLIIEKILKPLMEKKLVDGMGMQSHLLMDHPDLNDYRTALEMYGALGLEVQITELDMHCNDDSEASMQALAERYADFFRIYVEAKKSGKAGITSVTFWNLRDEDSWLPGFRREPSFPLLFHKQCEAKQAYYEVLKVAVAPEKIDKWEPHWPAEDFETAPKPQGEKKIFRQNIWEDGEYDYPAAYGFVPNLFAYLHNDNEKHDCMVIVPGGGYCMTVPHEGELAANVFYRHGMNVFVLSYTTDITMSVPLKQQPLKDISRTVRGLRKHGEEYGIDGKKLFICGFSAGGHVCGSLAVHFDEMPEENPLYKGISDRPDGVILSYPVLTSGKYTHADSIRALLGNDPDPAELDYFCLEKHVKENTPPCFLWQTRGDDLVPVQNTYLFAEALLEKNIPFAHHVFPAGGHGLSVASREQFAGWSGGDYTMEQCMRAAFSVKDGKGVNVSEQRKAEIVDQFFGGHEEPVYGVDWSLLEDVGKWTDLAWAWIRRITGDL